MEPEFDAGQDREHPVHGLAHQSGDVRTARCNTGEKFSQHARVCDSWFRRFYPLTDGITPGCDRFSMGSRTGFTFLTRYLARCRKSPPAPQTVAREARDMRE